MLGRLRARETDAVGGASTWKRQCARQRFSDFKLAYSHDTHDPDAANLKVSHTRRVALLMAIRAPLSRHRSTRTLSSRFCDGDRKLLRFYRLMESYSCSRSPEYAPPSADASA